MKNRTAVMILSITVCAFLAAAVYAEQAKDKKIVVESVTYEDIGEISSIGKDRIAIVYKHDQNKGVEYELNFLIDKDTVYQRVKSREDLQVGDTVKIKYIDTTTEDSDKNRATERKAAVISFIKAAAYKSELSSSEKR